MNLHATSKRTSTGADMPIRKRIDWSEQMSFQNDNMYDQLTKEPDDEPSDEEIELDNTLFEEEEEDDDNEQFEEEEENEEEL